MNSCDNSGIIFHNSILREDGGNESNQNCEDTEKDEYSEKGQ
ncbi:MAG: hypothetical protein ABIK28_00130 [Planctomycetota bacterium]